MPKKKKIGLTILEILQSQDPEFGFNEASICAMQCQNVTTKQCKKQHGGCSFLKNQTTIRYVPAEKYTQMTEKYDKAQQRIKRIKEHLAKRPFEIAAPDFDAKQPFLKMSSDLAKKYSKWLQKLQKLLESEENN